MNAKKLNSGNYRVQKMVDGVRYSMTFDHKPSDKDLMIALSDQMNAPRKPLKASRTQSFGKCIELYCSLKEERISPKYKAELIRLEERLGKDFCDLNVMEIKQMDIDILIRNLQKKKLQPKTVRNYICQTRAIIKKYNPAFNMSLDMLEPIPIKQDSEVYIPTDAEVKKIVEFFDKYYPEQYCGFALSCYGLRLGELSALTKLDIDSDNIVHITKSKVKNEFNQYVISDTKTVYSVREIPIDSGLADRIRKQPTEEVFPYTPNRLAKTLNKAQDKLGITHFNLHKMRHYFATKLHEQGVSDADVIRLGGWQKGSEVLDIIYRHSTIDQDRERRKQVLQAFSSNIF